MINYALKKTNDKHDDKFSLTTNRHPVVIIGSGPVGIRLVQLLVKQDPGISVVIYGNEPWEPYNRVQLSTFLAGDLDWLRLTRDQQLPLDKHIVKRFNCAITAIDRQNKTVSDETGGKQHYSKLIIATGSRPHVPQIRGVELAGIYNFRDLNDVQKLIARRVRSRRTVIIGGGVLGLEAARAMSRANTEVVIIDHNNRLMSSQLDEASAEHVKDHIMSLGIRVFLNSGVAMFTGEKKTTGVVLRNGKQINCDTVILATGIRPNIELARNAGLKVGKGIRVNDQLQTSDENIYAIGECAEHRKIMYGLVSPGYEQANVAVYCLQGKNKNSFLNRRVIYHGSITSTTLKVIGINVFSMGDIHAEKSKGIVSHYVYQDISKGVYRKIIVKRRRLVGAISIGQWDQIGRIQESISNRRFIWPLQLRKFNRTGEIKSENYSQDITCWPADTKVCNCTGVTRGELTHAYSQGNKTVEDLAKCTGASLVCGSCKPKLAEIVGAAPQIKPDIHSRPLLIFSIVAIILIILMLVAKNIPYSPTTDVLWQWDMLWRDNLMKQITGFTTIGVMILLALISLRKRWRKFRIFNYAGWRLFHIALGIFAIGSLIAHSGFRFGANLNFLLMTTVFILLTVGIFTSTVISLQHKLDFLMAHKLKEKFMWAHIIFLWPLPVLLGFHIFKTYFY